LPPDPENMNGDRAEWAAAALRHFQCCTGTDYDDSLPDLLGDLMHWCDRNGDGRLWFPEIGANQIGINYTAGSPFFERSAAWTGSLSGGITSGPDGYLWFTVTGAIGRLAITFDAGVNEYPISTTPNSMPLGITSGPDGNLWFVEYAGQKIGVITPRAGVTRPIGTIINEYSVPGANLLNITSGPDCNLWFTEGAAKKIGRITPTGAISEYTLPPNSGAPEGITGGPDGNIWFTEYDPATSIGKIGRVTTR
jgi:virginiamycin B lyase